MGKDIKIKLHQDGDQDCYFSGSEVKGEVVITVDKPGDFECVAVKLIGKAEVEWSEEVGVGDDRHTEKFENSTKYFKKKYVLWNKDTSEELSVGEHTFPFKHQLERVPPSFKGQYGKIEYEVKAKVDKEGPNPKTKTHITVRERADLMRECMEPQSFDEEGTVGFLCFTSGTMSMKCSLPRTGYSPGDDIPINVYLENLTTKEIKIEAFLKREDILTAENGHKRYLRNELTSLKSPPVQAGEITTFEGQSLKVSPEVPATIRSCAFISVEYTLIINADVPMAFDKTVKIPLVIQHKD